jgi:peptidoglycan/LPS O-acetylase OafA/YrhL
MTAVVAQHCDLLPFGWTGVWLFFVISGYVVTISIIQRQNALSGKAGLVEFFGRRAARIVPIYYLYIGIGLLFVLANGTAVDLVAVASLLGFFNNVAMAAGRGEIAWPVGHLWTISVEMQFYLLYGVLLFLASRRAVLTFLALSLLVAPMLRLAASIELSRRGWLPPDSAYAIYSGPFLHTDSFAIGALLAFASKAGLLQRIARPLSAVGFVLLTVYVVVYVGVNYTLGARGIDAIRNILSGVLWGQYREVVLYSVLAFASAGLVALASVQDRLIKWLLAPAPLRRIGEISYGAYVYHALAIVIARYVLQKLAWMSSVEPSVGERMLHFLLAYLLTIALAEISFRYFERWFLKRARPAAAHAVGAGAHP